MRFRFRNKTKKADFYREMCEFTETKSWGEDSVFSGVMCCICEIIDER